MTALTPADVRLVLQEDSLKDVRKHGRRQETVLRVYDVYHGDTHIGTVGLDMATFEQRTPGRMWVNKRWCSPRWFSITPDEHWGRPYHETRKAALNALLADIRHVSTTKNNS